ncbi:MULTISPECIES: hypothetical protein [unclassified Arthrobacter]|uniref:hypothetical protein n=1 Tax=unclassified Arthrobacter TaxID=235627 RepID=UPI001E3A0891|nr:MULTISPECIES: hypothetical protein [unclassified Arthrobacter]MCB5273702.1 hypothetical protein [Arthrobacter sp. SO5]MDI3214080.1 hypothetical protein [Arthrobacter sp. AL12]
MKRLSKAIIVASLPLAAIAIGVSPSMAETITTLDTATLVPALSQPQSSADAAVARTLPEKAAADHSTVRVLAQNKAGKYAVALDNTGQRICVIMQLTSEPGVGGSSCATKEQFAQGGVSVGVQVNGGTDSITTLLPGDVDTTALKALTASDGLTGRDASHIIAHPASARVPQQVELKRKNSSSKFVFNEIPLAFR